MEEEILTLLGAAVVLFVLRVARRVVVGLLEDTAEAVLADTEPEGPVVLVATAKRLIAVPTAAGVMDDVPTVVVITEKCADAMGVSIEKK